jgi:flagellar biosynthesis protein FliP
MIPTILTSIIISEHVVHPTFSSFYEDSLKSFHTQFIKMNQTRMIICNECLQTHLYRQQLWITLEAAFLKLGNAPNQ